MKVLHLILGVLIPPVGIFLTYGLSTTLVINILLTFLGWVPGSIHGVWAITKHYENLENLENLERLQRGENSERAY